MHAVHESPTFTFTADARSLLRQLAHTSQDRRATVDDLRDALEQPVAHEPPPTTLKMTPPLSALLARAQALATERQAPTIARQDLRQALAEHGAAQAGLDLPRLRFARWRLHRPYTTTNEESNA